MPDSLFGSDSDEDPPRQDPQVDSGTVYKQVLDSDENLSFSSIAKIKRVVPTTDPIVASFDPPPIRGFYLFPDSIPSSLQHSLSLSLSESIWPSQSNQVMLFDSPTRSSLPEFLSPLLDLLPSILSPLPPEIRDIIFDETKPRQCILNLYHPGQGISPHVDLPSRYEDGIVGISLLSSTVMEFTPVAREGTDNQETESNSKFAVRLKPGSVYVLSGEARYDYKHGIPYREEDIVMDRDGNETRIRRGVRMSITFRRMKEGAEIIGPT
ncbi:hypothetical protein JCM5350_004240 [Sporobolomyces pararoseus]